MPQVPVYGGPQVAADPLRPVQARALDVSSGVRQLGQGLANLGEGIDRNLETFAQTRANEIETNLTDEYNQWADIEQPKAVNQNASTWRSRVEAWWEDAKGRYGKDLDPYAARKVTEILARRRSIALNEAGRYQSVQEERYADSTAFSAMESAASSAVRSGAYDLELNRTRDLVYEMAARKSLDKDQRDALMAEQVGKFHRRVIDNLSAEQGLAYYDANSADIGDKPLRDALERNIKVEQKQRELDAKQAKADAEDAAMNQALTLYANNDKVPPSLMTTLAPRDRLTLMGMIEKRAEGKEIKSDPALVNTLRLDIAEGKPVRLRDYVGQLSPTHMASLEKLQSDAKSPEKQSSIATTAQMLANYKPRLKTELAIAQFNQASFDEISRFEREKGRPPSYDERRKIMDDLLLEKIVEEHWWGDDKSPRYQLPADERITEMGAYEQHEVGRTYIDKAGNKAVYRGNGQWEDVK